MFRNWKCHIFVCFFIPKCSEGVEFTCNFLKKNHTSFQKKEVLGYLLFINSCTIVDRKLISNSLEHSHFQSSQFVSFQITCPSILERYIDQEADRVKQDAFQGGGYRGEEVF